MNVPALNVRGKARLEIEEIVNYISADNPEAAQQLRNDIFALLLQGMS